jgi:hypothetical protein
VCVMCIRTSRTRPLVATPFNNLAVVLARLPHHATTKIADLLPFESAKIHVPYRLVGQHCWIGWFDRHQKGG